MGHAADTRKQKLITGLNSDVSIVFSDDETVVRLHKRIKLLNFKCSICFCPRPMRKVPAGG